MINYNEIIIWIFKCMINMILLYQWYQWWESNNSKWIYAILFNKYSSLIICLSICT
jgi:hypothetical protein